MKNKVRLFVLKESEEEEEPLSLEQKMHLKIRKEAAANKGAHSIFFIIFAILVVLTLNAWDNSLFLEGELTEEVLVRLQENTDVNKFASLGLMVFVGGLGIAVWIYSKKEIKEYNELADGFIRKSYLINFETAVPKGSTKVEKILNEAIKVFPELKETQKAAEKKGKKIHYEINKETGDTAYDLTLITKSGQYFLVKFMEKETYDDLKNIVKNTNKKFGKDKVFRLLMVGKDDNFDNIFQDYGFEESMNNLKRKFKLDLIVESDKGYSMVWID